jgi:ferric-dicitrate binding protein FerR (iron transport regulator)
LSSELSDIQPKLCAEPPALRRAECSRHKGVQQWLDTSAGSQAAQNNAPSANDEAANSPAPANNEAANTAAPARTARTRTRTASASQFGAGKVWVNLASKVYHCPNDRYYGKTKSGEYLSEAQAKSEGFRPDHGKTCEQRAAG